MKRTGNQKVVTAAKWLLLAVQRKTPPYCQNPFVKALSAPYRACTAVANQDPPLLIPKAESKGCVRPGPYLLPENSGSYYDKRVFESWILLPNVLY